MAACTSGRGLYSNISPGDPDIHRLDMTADPVGEACRLICGFPEAALTGDFPAAACMSGRRLYSNISPGDPDIHRQDMTADPVGEACRLIDDFLEQP